MTTHKVDYYKHQTKDNEPRICKLCAFISCDRTSFCCIPNLTIFPTLSRVLFCTFGFRDSTFDLENCWITQFWYCPYFFIWEPIY